MSFMRWSEPLLDPPPPPPQSSVVGGGLDAHIHHHIVHQHHHHNIRHHPHHHHHHIPPPPGPPSHHHTSTPTIKNHSVTHHENNLYCFGGYDGRRNHMTLYVFSLLTHRWSTARAASGTPPPGRNGHTATLAVSPSTQDAKIIIIGGWLGSGPLAASDTHVLDVSDGPSGLRWYQPLVRGTPPGPCNMHSADYVPSRDEVYVFRGGNGREYLNDLHALDVRTYEWRRVESTGMAPQRRANHSSAVLEETNELFIFGGWNGRERLNDVHVLDVGTGTWSRPDVGGELPHPRAGMTLTALRDRLYLFGGSGTSSKCFCDLQILDRKEMRWLDVHVEEDGAGDGSTGDGASRGGGGTGGGGNSGGDGIDGPGGIMQSFANMGLNGPSGRVGAHQQQAQAQDGGGASNAGASSAASAAAGENSTSVPPPQSAAASSAVARARAAANSDWRSKELGSYHHHHAPVHHHYSNSQSANPNDEDSSHAITLVGRGPGRRAGHTATAVNRFIYVFGGSCGSDYLNDFFVLDTDPPPIARVDEPTSLQLLERRLRHFFNEREFSDVTFVVEGRRVYGHKMVLSLVSDCFRAMFTTGFRESTVGEIEIPNCSYEGFMAMMEYVYTGRTPDIDVSLGDLDLIMDFDQHHHQHQHGDHMLRQRPLVGSSSSSSSSDVGASAGVSSGDEISEEVVENGNAPGDGPTVSAAAPSSAARAGGGGGVTGSSSTGAGGGGGGEGINRAVELLELADQFFLDHLKQSCERMLLPAVRVETCEGLLQVAQKTNAVQLERSCRHFMRNQLHLDDDDEDEEEEEEGGDEEDGGGDDDDQEEDRSGQPERLGGGGGFGTGDRSDRGGEDGGEGRDDHRQHRMPQEG